MPKKTYEDPELRGFPDNMEILAHHLDMQIEALERAHMEEHYRKKPAGDYTPDKYLSQRKILGTLDDTVEQLQQSYKLYSVGFVGTEIKSYARPHMEIIENSEGGVSYRGDERIIERALAAFIDMADVSRLVQYVRTENIDGLDIEVRNVLAAQIERISMLTKKLTRDSGNRGDG